MALLCVVFVYWVVGLDDSCFAFEYFECFQLVVRPDEDSSTVMRAKSDLKAFAGSALASESSI